MKPSRKQQISYSLDKAINGRPDMRGPKESVQEYLARGGIIRRLEPYGIGEYPNLRVHQQYKNHNRVKYSAEGL
jgi:hypothetical protein